mgnify:FL=1
MSVEKLDNGYALRFIANRKGLFDDDQEICLQNCGVEVRAGNSTTSAEHHVEAVASAGAKRTTRGFHIDSSGTTHLFSYNIHDDGIHAELHKLEEPESRNETLPGKDLARKASEDANAGVVLFYVMEPSERGDFEGDLSRFEVIAFVDGEEAAGFEKTQPE